jgi:DNA-binding protein HU-beta
MGLGGDAMVNKADVAAEVAERLKDADADARQYVDAVFDVIMQHVAAGERVQILGFGTFDSVERAARIGRNPRTGAAIQVPASVAPRFHAGQTFRSQVTDATPVAEAAPAEASTASATSAPVEAEVQQDAAKPAKAKKAKTAEKKAAKVVAEKPAKTAKTVKSAKKPAKPADKPAEKSVAKEATKEVAKPAAKKPAKEPKVSKKIAKKPAKSGKAAKK